jgi:hypothetical protein
MLLQASILQYRYADGLNILLLEKENVISINFMAFLVGDVVRFLPARFGATIIAYTVGEQQKLLRETKCPRELIILKQ